MTAANHYHAVGSSAYNTPTAGTSVFKAWDNFIYTNMIDDYVNGSSPAVKTPDGKADPDCSDSCHSIGRNSKVGTLVNSGVRLIPSLFSNIQEAPGSFMPPDYFSDYVSVNLDTPVNGDSAEYETLLGLGIQYPNYYCSDPASLEASAVGNSYFSGDSLDSDNGGGNTVFSTAEMALIPNKLRTFNTRDGLVCVNSDQSGGTCKDYQTAYYCGGWTEFQNHAPTGKRVTTKAAKDSPGFVLIQQRFKPATTKALQAHPIGLSSTVPMIDSHSSIRRG